MKQSKRLLCVLLSMLLMLSTLTAGVYAYKTSYQYPEGYDSVQQPYFSSEQAASALLDYIDDEVMAGINVRESYVGIDINIYSLDSTFDTIKGLVESAAYTVANIFSLGDIEDLNLSVPKNGNIRRRSTSMSDFEFLSYFLQFLQQNSDPLYKFADNTFSLGIIGNFVNLGETIPMLNDLHGYVNEMVYGLLIDSEKVGFDASTATLDGTVQDFINNRCVKFICDMLAKEDGTNVVADFLGIETNEDGTLKEQMGLLGLLPSLKAADIDITAVSTYDLISNIFNGLINDIVLPYAGNLILGALKIDPEDPAADTSYINIAIEYFVTNESVGLGPDATLEEKVEAFLAKEGVENPAAPKPIDKVNTTLAYILGDGIKQYLYFADDGNGGQYLTLEQGLVNQLSDLLKIALPMLNSLVPTIPALTADQEAALETMNQEQTFAFAVQFLLDTFVDGVRFEKNCDTIKELVTYTLVNVAANLVPEIDFEQKIANGEINPDSDQCLDVAAVIIRYYLVGETGIVIENETPTFVELLNDCFDYYLGKYAKLFNIYPNDSDYATYKDNVWYKLYMSVDQWIPLTNICYGVEDSWHGMQELIMDKIVNSILDFDIQGLLSIFGKRSDSDLQKPLTQVVINLLARVINGVFLLDNEKTSNKTDNAAQKDLIIPYSYTYLDQLVVNVISSSDANNGCGLKNTVKQLLYYITNVTGEDSLFSTSLDIVAELIGIIDLKDFDYMKVDYQRNFPVGTTYSIAQLKTLYDQYKISDNENIKYYEDAYSFFEMVDYAPWIYLDYKGSLKDVAAIIAQYDNAKVDPENYEFPTRADITYAYYALSQYHTFLMQNQTVACNYQLNKVYNKALAANYTNVNEDGSQKYTDRSWNAYSHAIAFAQKVMNEYASFEADGTLSDYQQSKINTAREMLIDAMDGLKAFVGAADYTDLDIAINRVPSLSNPRFFSEASVQKVLDAYKDALATDRDYDVDDQRIVDLAYDKLTEAIGNLETIPYMELQDPTAQFIDNDFNFMYGFHEDFYNAEDAAMWNDYFYDYFWDYATATDGYVELIPTACGNGTGSKLQLIVDLLGDGVETVVTEYTLILFGDINGDSYIDGRDAVLMRAYASFMLDAELSPEYVSYASDINFDGNIGISDAKTVESAGVGKASVSQTPEYYTSKEFSFIGLLNK